MINELKNGMAAPMMVRPKDGAIVRHPATKKPLSVDGEWVEITPYWQRRLNSGDIVVVSKKQGDK